ncbi:hypothetical protein ACC723_38540, partial [Rhizobium ruizarguesonis]
STHAEEAGHENPCVRPKERQDNKEDERYPVSNDEAAKRKSVCELPTDSVSDRHANAKDTKRKGDRGLIELHHIGHQWSDKG